MNTRLFRTWKTNFGFIFLVILGFGFPAQAFAASAETDETAAAAPKPAGITTGTWHLPPLMEVFPGKAFEIATGRNGGVWMVTRSKANKVTVREWVRGETGAGKWVTFRRLGEVPLSRLAGGPFGTVFFPDLAVGGFSEDGGAEMVHRKTASPFPALPLDLAIDDANACWFIDSQKNVQVVESALPSGLPGNQTGIAVDSTGTIWLVGADSVIRRVPKAGALAEVGTGKAVACGGDGSVWSLDPTQRVLRRFEGNAWRIKGMCSVPIERLAVDSRGCPWLLAGASVYTTERGLQSGFDYAPVPGPRPSLPKRPTAFFSGFKYAGVEKTCIWNDAGSGGDFDISFWRVPLPSGYVRFGDYAHPSHATPADVSMLVAEDDPLLFKPPTGYVEVWNEKGSKIKRPVSIWAPVPPAGYRALGHVAVAGHAAPAVDYIRCVKADLAVSGSIIGPLYIDKGTKADKFCSIYAIGVTFRDFATLEKPPKFRNAREWAMWVAARANRALAMAAAKKSFKEAFLVANSFWASGIKDWKVSAKDASVFVLKAPPVDALAAYLQERAFHDEWPAAVVRWKNWRTFLWKKEEFFRAETRRLYQKQLKRLMASQASPAAKAPISESVASSGTASASLAPSPLEGYEEYKKQAQAEAAALPAPLEKKASPPPAAPGKRSSGSFPVGEDKAVASFFQGGNTAAELPLEKLPCLKQHPGIKEMMLRDVTRTVTPSHLILTGKMNWLGQKDADAFVAIHAGIDKKIKGSIGVLPTKPVRIRDCVQRSTDGHAFLDRCLTFSRSAVILASDDDQLEGGLLAQTPLGVANARAVLAPTSTTDEFQVGVKTGLNLFAVAVVPESGPLGILNKIPGWPAESYWKGVLAKEAESHSLTGTIPVAFPGNWAVKAETITVGLTTKPVLTLGMTLKAVIGGKTAAFACTMTKELGKAGSMSGFSLLGSAECAVPGCKPPCGHFRLPFLGLSLSRVLLKYSQEYDEKKKALKQSFGIAGTLKVGKKSFEVAAVLPTPPSFDDAAFRGKTTEKILFHDLLVLAAGCIKGLDHKIGGALPEFGFFPIEQPVPADSGPSTTEKVVLLSVAKKGDDDLGIPGGISLKGGLVLAGRELGAFDLLVDEATGIRGSAIITPLDLGGVLQIRGNGHVLGPTLEIRLNMKEQVVRVSGRADFLGLNGCDLTLELTSAGMVAHVAATVFGQLEARVEISGKPSLADPGLQVVMVLKETFLKELSAMVSGMLAGSLLGDAVPFSLDGAVVRGTLKKPSDSLYELGVTMKVFGLSQEMVFADFDLAHPKKSMEVLARRIADYCLSQTVDLAEMVEKEVIASVETVNQAVNVGVNALSKTLNVDFIGVKKGLDQVVGEGFSRTRDIAAKSAKSGVEVANQTVKTATQLAGKVADKVKGFFSDVGRDGGVFNPKNW
jgi:hypothetical protein